MMRIKLMRAGKNNFKYQLQLSLRSEYKVLSRKGTHTLKAQADKLWRKKFSILMMSNKFVTLRQLKFYKDLPDRTNRSTEVNSSKRKQHRKALRICNKNKIQSQKVNSNRIKMMHACLNLDQSLIIQAVTSHLIKVSTFNRLVTKSQVNESSIDHRPILETRFSIALN
jgi:hypothetical protein